MKSAKNGRNQPGDATEMGVTAPLVFSGVLAVVSAVLVFVFARGGSSHGARFDLALITGGSVFIISVVLCAMFAMSAKPNDEPEGVTLERERRQAKEREAREAAGQDEENPA